MRAIISQYRSMFGDIALCDRSADAHVISNSPFQVNPHPQAMGIS